MTFTTLIQAIDPHTGEFAEYAGPLIEADSWEQAQLRCDALGLGYCKVDGEFTGEHTHIFKHELN